MTRTVAIILLVAAAGVLLLGGLFLFSGLAQGNLTAGGATLGFALLAVFLAGPLAAVGLLSLVRSRQEGAEEREASLQRRILDMVKTRGQINVSDVIVETQTDLPTVQSMIYKLVGMGVFSGYVNWDEGTLYSEQASELRELRQCRNCGGDLTLAGQGVVKCPYCGTEYFLS